MRTGHGKLKLVRYVKACGWLEAARSWQEKIPVYVPEPHSVSILIPSYSSFFFHLAFFFHEFFFFFFASQILLSFAFLHIFFFYFFLYQTFISGPETKGSSGASFRFVRILPFFCFGFASFCFFCFVLLFFLRFAFVSVSFALDTFFLIHSVLFQAFPLTSPTPPQSGGFIFILQFLAYLHGVQYFSVRSSYHFALYLITDYKCSNRLQVLKHDQIYSKCSKMFKHNQTCSNSTIRRGRK